MSKYKYILIIVSLLSLPFFPPFFGYTQIAQVFTTISLIITSSVTTTPTVIITPPLKPNAEGGGIFEGETSVKLEEEPKIIPMLNVSELSYSLIGSRISFSWKNPPLKDGDFVKILISPKFYPLDPYDGVIIFKGESESYSGKEIIDVNIDYYSSLFVCRTGGSCSSGTTILIPSKAQINKVGIREEEKEKPLFDLEISPGEIRKIIVFQNGKEIPSSRDIFNVDSSETLKIGIETSIPDNEIKTVLIEINDKNYTLEGKTYSFLGEWSEIGKRFETSGFNIGKGEYSVEISFFDLQKNIIESRNMTLSVKETQIKKTALFSVKRIADLIVHYWYIIIGILLIIFIWFVGKKRITKNS